MVKRIVMLILVLALASAMAIEKRTPKNSKVAIKKNDTFMSMGKEAFNGTLGATFDKSSNGYGWYQGYNRKIQVYQDPINGATVGSIYRQQSNTSGSGTIGGMVGIFGTEFTGYAQTLYSVSPYQGSPYADGNPGGRYPYASEFINGYFFGLFNDYNLLTSSADSQPMYAVADATLGWDLSFWSAPDRIEATEGGAVMPGAWTGIGDVVYDEVSGYYYWTTNWNYDLALIDDAITGCMVGRTQTPADMDSWEWTDYSELYFDCTDDETGVQGMGNLHVAYCKDTNGYGNGYGIALCTFYDVTYEMFDSEGNALDVIDQPRLGYMYTTNWGADSDTGDFTSNWHTPNEEGNNFFPADINKVFDWYGTTISGDSIGVDSLGNTIYDTVPMNWPYITWNISAVATENNIVHVLLKVTGGSTEDDYLYYLNDEKTITGYYDLVGEITDTGVVWKSANMIAQYMGIDDDDTEWKYSNTHDLALGYAGKGVFYATWIDRPETRYTANAFPDPNKEWIDEVYFTYSNDHGKTWFIDHTVAPFEDAPEYELKYAVNITNTPNLQDEGFTVAFHGENYAEGTDHNGVMTVYGICQYYDPENPLEPPVNDYYDHQQFLKVWKINGTETGIETEDVSIEKDFALYQNYPNPFNPLTDIQFRLQNNSKVKLSVFNTKGEMVAELANGKLLKGLHSISFDASSYNSGVYFYKLEVNGMSETKKMVLTK